MTELSPANRPPAAAAAEIHYGGPYQPPRALRNLLKARIEAATPGSEIVWATYYFRDRELADALVAAHRRGVRVRVVVDARPRRESANAPVIAKLSEGLGEGLRLHRSFIPGARLHAKIYTFSAPVPTAFIGSFNPSGDRPEDPDVVAEIGDQDRGHNLLIQFRDPAAVEAMRAQADRLWRKKGVSRFLPGQNRPVVLDRTTLFFFPRLRPDLVERSIADLGSGDQVRAAVSHVAKGPFTERLARAARRGARVELIVHDTRRRAPDDVVASLARAGVAIRRYCHPQGLPMHAKFVIVDNSGRRAAWFGSLNYNLNSRYVNHEILARSTDPRLIEGLHRRFVEIDGEAARHSAIATGARTGSCQDRSHDPGLRIPALVRTAYLQIRQFGSNLDFL